ncbi:MAG: ribosome biogenesis GTPase YlqF [Candidatus Lambdaproteobacteria bacterium RIFOXYC1_FULL_56_13]|nr:MAG: ribosome biogenesis GTPase YlqF [Candidatus Lambdaproteobacteria bacterium RIFOXYC1_FULL_56_13]
MNPETITDPNYAQHQRINWFPGHMKKAFTEALEKLKQVDLIIEVRDARMPQGSGNQELEKKMGQKARLVVFNKERFAHAGNFRAWLGYFRSVGLTYVVVDALDQRSVKKILAKARELAAPKQESFKRRGITPPPVRMMVLGLPNTGKSTLINSFRGKKQAAVGDRPGITKMQQWVVVDQGLELLDTPGIMPPRIDSDLKGLGLCAIHAIRDEIPGPMRLAKFLSRLLAEQKPQECWQRYGLDREPQNGDEILEAAATWYGALRKGGEVDWSNIYAGLIQDYRKGNLGPLWFEEPPEPTGKGIPVA